MNLTKKQAEDFLCFCKMYEQQWYIVNEDDNDIYFLSLDFMYAKHITVKMMHGKDIDPIFSFAWKVSCFDDDFRFFTFTVGSSHRDLFDFLLKLYTKLKNQDQEEELEYFEEFISKRLTVKEDSVE